MLTGLDGGRLFARPGCDVSVEACFPRALFGTSMVLFESSNEKITATRDYPVFVKVKSAHGWLCWPF